MFGKMKLNVTQWEERGVDPMASSRVVIINLQVTETQLIHNSVYDSCANVAAPRSRQLAGLIVSPVCL